VWWVTSHGISAWQNQKISWSCSDPNVGCQNRNTTTFRAMMARVTNGTCRVGLSSRRGITRRLPSDPLSGQLSQAQQVAHAGVDLHLTRHEGGQERPLPV